MNEPVKHAIREQWLQAAVTVMTPTFEVHNFKVPAIHVSTGWPSKGGCGTRKRTLGQCWDAKASEDGKCQIFISPMLLQSDDPCSNVLQVLIHEVCHAVVGCAQGHGKAFKSCATAVGLEGKMTSTHASPDLMARFTEWMKELGPYPHSQLNPKLSGIKKQTTRMIKCECACGFIVRASRKALEETGAPICPHNKESMKFDLPDADDGEGDSDD